MLIALTRPVSPTINDCELTHLERAPIDVAQAIVQHESYARCLADLGCQIRQVTPAPDLPDAVFVEDSAVVLDEIGVITRPGVPSRQAETVTVAEALRVFRIICEVQAPGTLDGGDVLRVDRTLYVGRSGRTNAEGIAQLERFAAPFGYEVKAVDTTGCLHLKTAVTEVADGTLLLNPQWVCPDVFDGYQLIDCDPSEPFAANALRIGETVVHAAAWQHTRERMETRGIQVVPVDASELAKAEAGVTCCSVVFRA